jgi:hypothetical protein
METSQQETYGDLPLTLTMAWVENGSKLLHWGLIAVGSRQLGQQLTTLADDFCGKYCCRMNLMPLHIRMTIDMSTTTWGK